MSASVNDKITDTRNAARPNSARSTGTRSSGGISLACDNLTGWPVASKVHFVTYQIDSNSNPVAGTQLDCYGIVSGNTINSFTVVDGNDNGNGVGEAVEMLPTAAWGQGLADALMTSLNRDGTLKDGSVSTAGMLSSSVVTTPKIADSAITTAKINNAAVTADKLAVGAQTATVATTETTTSTSYTDLTTTTDTVTATIGANGLALVIVSGELLSNTSSALTYMSYAASGANTIAASDARALFTKVSGSTGDSQASYVKLHTGLTPGSTVFKAKYRVGAGTGTYANREITVIPL